MTFPLIFLGIVSIIAGFIPSDSSSPSTATNITSI